MLKYSLLNPKGCFRPKSQRIDFCEVKPSMVRREEFLIPAINYWLLGNLLVLKVVWPARPKF